MQVGNLGVSYTAKGAALPFLAVLFALEGTTLTYWIGYIRLFKVQPSGSQCRESLLTLSASPSSWPCSVSWASPPSSRAGPRSGAGSCPSRRGPSFAIIFLARSMDAGKERGGTSVGKTEGGDREAARSRLETLGVGAQRELQ